MIPIRDDGTCKIDDWCKYAESGIAIYANKRDFDTYLVIERINDHVVLI